jgi:hypothetical protein
MVRQAKDRDGGAAVTTFGIFNHGDLVAVFRSELKTLECVDEVLNDQAGGDSLRTRAHGRQG